MSKYVRRYCPEDIIWYLNINPELIEQAFTEKTKVILPVHLKDGK